MNTSILGGNSGLGRSHLALAKTEAHPSYPASGTLPMITVPRVARPKARRVREPRPPMPVFTAPRRELSTTVKTTQPSTVGQRAFAALLGFVLALAACTLAYQSVAVAQAHGLVSAGR